MKALSNVIFDSVMNIAFADATGMPVTIGSRFGDWQVTWGYWTKHRLSFLVMVVRVKMTSSELRERDE
jgi:hypothetical protein